MTFPETLEQCPTTESFNTDEGGLVYEEESLFGYRSYEKQGLTPAFRKSFRRPLDNSSSASLWLRSLVHYLRMVKCPNLHLTFRP